MPPRVNHQSPQEEPQAPAPLTPAQLHALYANPHDIIPPHTLEDLVAGMKRELGIKTGYAQGNGLRTTFPTKGEP
jgi:hypothetical protein